MPAQRTFRASNTASSSMSALCETCFRASCHCGSPTPRSESNARVRRSTRHSQQLPPLRLLIPALEVKAEQQNIKVPGNDPWKSVSDLSSGRDHGRDGGRDGGHQIADSSKWRHPAELEYVEPRDWDEDRIINYLLTDAAFSLPPRDPGTSSFPWVKISPRNPNDGIVTVPRGYRIPLMFSAKFMWDSLRLVLESPTRTEDWEECKFDILHVARLCARFLGEARRAQAVGGGKDKERKRMGGMHRAWRCATFDRTLIRYFRRWLVSREDFLREFWLEFDEDEFEVDVLKRDWTAFALKGHKGFCLTRDEIQDGISFDTLTNGLTRINGRWSWDTSLPRHLPPTSHVSSAATSPSTSTSSPNTTPMDLDTNATPHIQTQPRPQTQPQPPQTPIRNRSRSSSLSSSPLSAAPSLIDLELDNFSPSLRIKRELVEAGLLADPDVLAAAAHKQESIEHVDWIVANPDPEPGCVYHRSGAPERPIVVGDQGTLVAYPSPVSDGGADGDNTNVVGGEGEHGKAVTETPSTLPPATNLDSGGVVQTPPRADDPAVRVLTRGLVDVEMGDDTAKVSFKAQRPEQGTERKTNDEKQNGSLQPGTDPIEARSSATSNASAQEVAEICLGGLVDVSEGEGGGDTRLTGENGDRNTTASSTVGVERAAKDAGTEEYVVNITTTKFFLLRHGLSIPCGSDLAPPHPVPTLPSSPSSAPPVPQTRFVLMRDGNTFLGPRPLPVGYRGPAYSRSESQIERESLTSVTQTGPITNTKAGKSTVLLSARKPSLVHACPDIDPNASGTFIPPASNSIALKDNANLFPGAQQRAQETTGIQGGQNCTEQDADIKLRTMRHHFSGEMLVGKAAEGAEWATRMVMQRDEEAKSGNGMGMGMGTGVGIGAGERMQSGLGKRKREDGDKDGNGSGKRKAAEDVDGGVRQTLVPAHVAVAREWLPGQTELPPPTPKNLPHTMGTHSEFVGGGDGQRLFNSATCPVSTVFGALTTTDAQSQPPIVAPKHDRRMEDMRPLRNIASSFPKPRSISPPLTPRRDTNPGESAMIIGDGNGYARNGLVSLCHETLIPGADDGHPKHTTMPSRPHTSPSIPLVKDGVAILGVDGRPSQPEIASLVPPSPRFPSQPNPQHGPSTYPSAITTSNPPPISSKSTSAPIPPLKSQPKLKPQYTKSWNERVAAAMESARQVRVRGHEEGDVDVDGFLAMMEGLKIPEQELELDPEHIPVTATSSSVADTAAESASASASTSSSSPASTRPVDAELGQRNTELMTTEPTVAVQKDSGHDANTDQVVATGGIGVNELLTRNKIVDPHESPDGYTHTPCALSEQNERTTSSTATNTEQDAAATGTGDMMVDGHDLPPAPHPFAHTPSAIVEQDPRDKVTSPVPKAQKHSVHEPDAAQGITTSATGVGVMDRNMAVAGREPSPRLVHHTTTPGTQNYNDTAAGAASLGGSGSSTELGRDNSNAFPYWPDPENTATASDLPQPQSSSSVSQTYNTLVDSMSTPAPALATRPYRKISQAHVAVEPTAMPMDHGPVVTKVVSMFRDTLVGLTDILETVGREDAKKVTAQASPLTPTVPAPLPRTPSTSHGRPELEGSTSASLVVVSQLLDEIKGLRQQMQEEKEQKEERDREVRQLQSEMDHLRREIGVLDFRAPTNDDDGVVDMDISPSSSVPASPTLSMPATASRKRRFRDLYDNDRARSPHPLSHLLVPTMPLPLRLPQRMSRMSITPLVPPFEGESSRALSIASTPVVSTPPPTDLLPSSMTSLRTPSPCPRPVPYDCVPLPIKSQRKQHMFFQSDRQQN